MGNLDVDFKFNYMFYFKVMHKIHRINIMCDNLTNAHNVAYIYKPRILLQLKILCNVSPDKNFLTE